jgi:hypothetical protein
MSDFQARARALGHDLKGVGPGQGVNSTITVHNIDELRQVLYDNAPIDTRAQRAAAIRAEYPEVDDESNATGDTLMRRIEEYVYGDAPISQLDRQRIHTLFPTSVVAVSIADKTLQPGEVWDLGTSSSVAVVNLGTLTMESGSSIVIRNTVLSFKVDTLVRNTGSTTGPNYDLAILGATGATGTTGNTGGAGGNGSGGSPGTCSSPGISGDPGGPGQTGPAGGKGAYGGQGGLGLASLTADINIGTGGITGSAGQFIILTRSGTGGIGGVGGAGGAGGAGGVGGTGATCGCEGTNGGNGGRGGTGGAGGTGGDGGNGSNGSDIYVLVPTGQRNRVVRVMQPAPPGNGGTGGNGGAGGSGGGGGAAGKHQQKGNGGGSGPGGSQGFTGKPGTQSGAPGTIYINEN